MSNMKVVNLVCRKIDLVQKAEQNDKKICDLLYLAAFRYQKLIDPDIKEYSNSKILFEKEFDEQSFCGHITEDSFCCYDADLSKIASEAAFMKTQEAKSGYLFEVESFFEDPDQSNWKMSGYTTTRYFTSEFVGLSEAKYKKLFLAHKNKGSKS